MKERVDDNAHVKQLTDGAWSPCKTAGTVIVRRAACGGLLAVQISPVRRNQRTRAIGQDQHQMQRPSSMRPPEHLQRCALQGVALTDDRYAFRIAIEVVVGSVSCLPSAGSLISVASSMR